VHTSAPEPDLRVQSLARHAAPLMGWTSSMGIHARSYYQQSSPTRSGNSRNSLRFSSDRPDLMLSQPARQPRSARWLPSTKAAERGPTAAKRRFRLTASLDIV
jgi:hypothetical protein